jgi:hypothetical protein
MGFFINYSAILCTKHNTPLTTTVIGCLKNVIVTIAGIFVGGDYVYSANNFIGLLISTASSVLYSVLSYKNMKSRKKVKTISYF